jgi:hypothetical protein
MRRTIPFTLAILLMAGNVLAQLDPVPDGIGIYFDMDALQVCATAGTGTIVPIYVTTTRLSSRIMGWEAHVVLPDPLPAGHSILAWTILPDGLNISAPPDFIVGLSTPVSPQPSYEVLRFDLAISGMPACIPFSLRPSDRATHPGHMVYTNGFDSWWYLHYSAGGDYSAPCAMLNCPDCDDTVVETEPSTWGAIKALYGDQ